MQSNRSWYPMKGKRPGKLRRMRDTTPERVVIVPRAKNLAKKGAK